MDKQIESDIKDVIKSIGDLNQKFSGKKILLTGSAGFLGSQFVNYFTILNNTGILKKPCYLYAWDNYLLGKPDWLNQLQNRSDLSVCDKDVTKNKKFPEVDYIIHAASVASPTYYRKYPIETIDANIIGLRNLLDACRDYSLKSFLFFSTSEIYGDADSNNIPTSESYRGYVSCTGPRACYDESKRLGETLCVNYWQLFKTPVKIVRPFNNYGPGLKISDKRVIPDFFNDVINNRDISMLSDGKATRTFCYISDALEGYLRILLSKYNGEPFNIGSPKPEISLNKLATEIIKIAGANLRIKYMNSSDSNYLTDNPQRRCPSVVKAKKLLGFSPKISLKEGLERTYKYYLRNSD